MFCSIMRCKSIKCSHETFISSVQLFLRNLNNSCHTSRTAEECITSFTETMSSLVKVSLLFLAGATTLSATALDDYVWKADDHYKWVDMVR